MDTVDTRQAEPLPSRPAAMRGIGIAAAIIMAGNLSSSLLGFVRQAIIPGVFGENRSTDAFFAASIVPQMFYDLTIGAAISAALIPTFTEIAERRGTNSLAGTVGNVLALAWLVLTVVTALLIAAAEPIMRAVLVEQHSGTGLDESVRIVRVMAPALLFLGTSAVLLSTLYSVRRFTMSAFSSCFYHLGVIAGALFLARPLGIIALSVGAVGGAAAQALVQVPVLLRTVGGVRPSLALTPEVRSIVRLYAPVAAGLLVSLAGQIADLHFKWSLGKSALTAMTIATTFVQFPIGIGVAALGFAILPSISSDAAFQRIDEFKQTLAFGLRLVLFLTVPAAIGYLVLATPIMGLLIEHGHVNRADTHRSSTALLGYAAQIPFVGVDQLLIFAFYARKNTVTPMLVGVLGVIVYIGSALILLPRLHIFGLALANTIQNTFHAVILLVLLLLSIGSLRGTHLATGAVKTCIAAAVMGVGAALTLQAVMRTEHGSGVEMYAVQVVAPMIVAVVLYFSVALALRSEELRLLLDLARRRAPAHS